jgi:very-long-chain enoyl-CoA reductase
MKITIASRNPKSSKFPVQLELVGSVDSIKTNDVNKALAKKFPTYYPDRQRLTTEDKKVLDSNKTLKEQGIDESTTIYFKDLGPQIGWRTVFMIEYGGPLLILPIFYHFGKNIYGGAFEHSTMQTATYYMVMAHFLKRELETIFVHRFSHGTMPFRNVFKNSAHYWLLSGANLAFWVFGPWFAKGKAAGVRNDVWLYGSIAVWAVSKSMDGYMYIMRGNN